MHLDSKIDDLIDKIHDKATVDDLTPKERIMKTTSFQKPDRVPVTTQLHDHAARITGLSVREIATDPMKLAYAQLYGLEKYLFDNIVIGVDMYDIEVEAVGTRIRYPEESMPIIVRHAIEDRKDLEGLSMPDPDKDGRMPYILEVSRLYQERLGDIFPFNGVVAAPFSIAVNLRGYINLLKDFREDPDFAHKLMRFATDLCIFWGKTQMREIGFNVNLADAWGTLPHISPQIFEEFSLTYTTYAMGRLRSSCSSICRGLRFFKDWRPWMRKILSTGMASYTVFQEDIEAGIDLEEAQEFAFKHGKRFAIIYDPRIIQFGTKEEIRRKVRKYMQKCASRGGFTITPNNIPADASVGNVLCFVDAIHEYGQYPRIS